MGWTFEFSFLAPHRIYAILGGCTSWMGMQDANDAEIRRRKIIKVVV